MDMEEKKTRLVILKQPSKNKGQYKKKNKLQLAKLKMNQIQQRAANIISKQIISQKEIFLPYDVYLEYNGLDNDEGFQVYKQLFKQLRPVVSLNHLKQDKFIQINLDQAQRGIQDFSFLIYQLNSLQDQQYHEMANEIQVFQNNLSFFNKLSQKRKNPEVQSRNYEIFNKFMNEELKSLLEQQDIYGFYTYNLMQCIDDLSDARSIQQGCNENFIKLLGFDVENYINFIMRQGFFEVTSYTKRNESSLEFLNIVKSFVENGFDFSSIMISDNIDILTFDGLKISPKIVPQIHICYGLEEDGDVPGKRPILGYLNIEKYILDQKQVQYILKKRQSKTKQLTDQVYEQPEQSFQHFQYNCSVQHFTEFYQRYSEEQIYYIHDRSSNSNLDSKTCKIRLL
ncbi:hypothetical protein TTHERM_00582190 (macronuclear) [Tetrahymena thermophila SB210]|uniref:Uncharacterized protein n=1 Tax=Tetrahymena thermophila (strain SB210) TaxID=312017 RepID=Q23Q71_TETTS|nr:hypothetical protein TTHERM_00582190 [Tetrahymena thermophila SB210]EAR98713.2 hypothetical protein TTHERM_00582190 [Tetrahymena thermophila SB210]|eukprot:XP_001018958.2 hypothetical protein TTHERM_00582190 [Tetrahymena thermophila SB210]